MHSSEPVRGVPKPGEDLWSAMYADHDALVKSQLLRAPTPACAPASPPVPDAGCSDASGETSSGGSAGAGERGTGTGLTPVAATLPREASTSTAGDIIHPSVAGMAITTRGTVAMRSVGSFASGGVGDGGGEEHSVGGGGGSGNSGGGTSSTLDRRTGGGYPLVSSRQLSGSHSLHDGGSGDGGAEDKTVADEAFRAGLAQLEAR
jgi:hypothetical protein